MMTFPKNTTQLRHFIKISLTLLLSMIAALPAASQRSYVKGIIWDEAIQGPVEGAAIRLNKLPDSTFVKGTITDMKGSFHINGISSGNYCLQISFLGYKTIEKTIKLSVSDTLNIARIPFTSSDVQLQEVVVTGKQPGVKINNDTVEYVASAYRTQKSAVVEDLLKKLPGVEIDEEGKIMVNGQEIKQVMIDGKEFFGNDPKIATKYLPTDMIEMLQVVEKKSDLEEVTGIDDGNRQYVINLKVKRDMKRGVFGTAAAGAGTEGRYEANALINRFANERQITGLFGSNNTNNMGFSDMLKGIPSQIASQVAQAATNGRGEIRTHMAGANYADLLLNKKLKIDGNLFLANFNREELRDLHRKNFQASGFNTVNQAQSTTNESTQFKTGWRLDYRPTPQTRIFFRPNIVVGNGKQRDEVAYETLQGDTTLIDSAYSKNHYKDKNFYLNGTLTINHNLRKRGRSISMDIAGQISHTLNNSDTWTDKLKFPSSDPSQPTPTPLTWQYSDRTTDRNEYRIRLNYSEPISKTLQITTSYQFKKSTTITDKVTHKWNKNTEEFEFLPSQSDRFDNIFNNHRFELGIRKYWKGINLRIGGAVEPSHMLGYSYKADTLFYAVTKNSMDVSPYVNFVCPFSKEKILRLDVWANTRQPSGTQLQPIRDESNPSYIRDGNPDLKPIITTRIRLRYNDYNKKTQRTIVLNLGIDINKNSITNRTQYIDKGVQLTKPININGVWNAYFTFMYNVPLNPHFRLSSYTTGNYNRNINFISDKDNPGGKNINNNTRLRERLLLSYRNDILEIGAKTDIHHNYADYSLQKNMNVNAFNIINGGNLEIRFPKDMGGILVDYDYNMKKGYSEGFDRSEHILSAQLNVSVFKNKCGTISIKGYDILGQKQAISRNIRSNNIEDIQFNTLPRYIMFQFSYRFNYFAKAKF